MPPNFNKYWAAINAGDHLVAKKTRQSKKPFHAQTLQDNGMGSDRDTEGNIPPPNLKHAVKTVDKAAWDKYRRENYTGTDGVTAKEEKDGDKESKDGAAKEKVSKDIEEEKAGDGKKP